MGVKPRRAFPVGLADVGVLLGVASLLWGLWTLFRPLFWIALGVVLLHVGLRTALHERTHSKEPSA